MTQQCNAWEEKFLSAAGKETLIKSVAQAIPVYVMSVFLLPASVHQALERCIGKYWWGELAGTRKTHWIS
jgi:hypothetical protein